jgi:ubiquitin-activating enzyme E1
VKEWNPQLQITALEAKVGPDSEDFFDDKFWESLTVCWNALDNVMARKYTDKQCLLYSKPLLESGTLGTKCNHEVILPYRTSTYNDGKESDENETQIAMCTLRSFSCVAPLYW